MVVQALSPSLFKVADQKRVHVMHHDRLKVCEDREVPIWARCKRHAILEAAQVAEVEAGMMEPDSVDTA